jgi:outer membrane protein OmpA-like peptidoglycan-associated protein
MIARKPVRDILLIHLRLLMLLSFFGTAAVAQTDIKAANREFERMSYIEAAKKYEQFISEAGGDHKDIPEALSNLAFSYKKLQDSKNAERIYRTLFENHKSILDSKEYLYFAQVLASNSKYRESQQYYALYGQLQAMDSRARNFTVAYMDRTNFFRDSSLYKVRYVEELNSRQADFSPMYYKKGIVFVSARNESGFIKRVFMNNQTPFLDLYIYPDTATLLSVKTNNTASAKLSSGVSSSVKSAENMEVFSKKLNSKYHEGPLTFFSDERQLIFTRNSSLSKNSNDKTHDGVNKLKLYSAKSDGSKWDHIEELPFNSDHYSCGHPALNRDNTKLYFVSDMPGGYGGTDIYSVEYKNGSWGLPVNLGREINSEGNEMFPFVDEYNNLYFASDGHAGLGGLDIFYVEMNGDKPVMTPENLGFPINSEKDDFGLITDGERNKGLFSSNRLNGFADDNIYSFQRECREIDILVYDSNTGEVVEGTEVRMIKHGVNQEVYITDKNGRITLCMPPGLNYQFKAFKQGYETATVGYETLMNGENGYSQIKINLQSSKLPLVKGTIRSELTNEPIAGATVVLTNTLDESTETLITGKDGKYTFQPVKKGKYVVSAVKENYATNTEEVGKIKPKKKEQESYEQNLGMIAAGDIFRIENIYYDYGKTDIRRSARKELTNTVLPVLKKYPDIEIEIRSHTDSRSSQEFNMELSQERAMAVVEFLAKHGVEKGRMQFVGYGETMLVNECGDDVDCSERKHQQNRRTEFKILNVGNPISKR